MSSRFGRRSTLTVVLSVITCFTVSACSKALEAGADNAQSSDRAAHGIPDSDGPEIVNPPSVTSTNGVLAYTVTAAPARVTVAGRTFLSNVYNGSYIPPVLRVKRGDEVRITFVNRIDKADIEIEGPESSNVHYHGMNISPNEPADNPYISIPSSNAATVQHGEAFTPGHESSLIKSSPTYEYVWRVPTDHPQGLYWFHSHAHAATERQLLSGMSGLLVVEGLFDEHYPELAAVERRTLILRDIDLPGALEGAPKTKTINGITGGWFRTRPGKVEIWEIGNLGADSYFDLAIDGHTFWVIARDGNPLTRPEQVMDVFIPPSSRATVAIEAGVPGRYGVRSLAVDTGSAGDPNPSVQLATFIVDGAPVDNASLVARLKQPAVRHDTIGWTADSLRQAPIARRRRVVYTESANGKIFFINGKQFDPNRIDFSTTLGDVEEWTIVNDTDERHTFHIHQLDYLVTKINGKRENATGLRDNIDIPFRDPMTKAPGTATVILPFTDPLFVGKFMFHCHISEHSDNGMMANMLVQPRPAN